MRRLRPHQEHLDLNCLEDVSSVSLDVVLIAEDVAVEQERPCPLRWIGIRVFAALLDDFIDVAKCHEGSKDIGSNVVQSEGSGLGFAEEAFERCAEILGVTADHLFGNLESLLVCGALLRWGVDSNGDHDGVVEFFHGELGERSGDTALELTGLRPCRLFAGRCHGEGWCVGWIDSIWGLSMKKEGNEESAAVGECVVAGRAVLKIWKHIFLLRKRYITLKNPVLSNASSDFPGNRATIGVYESSDRK